MRASRTLGLLALPMLSLLIPACDGGGFGLSPTPVTDFHLIDMNTHSKTHGDAVSPRDYLRMSPAFYFTHAN